MARRRVRHRRRAPISRRRPRIARRTTTPTTALAQTYLEQYEDITPRAPLVDQGDGGGGPTLPVPQEEPPAVPPVTVRLPEEAPYIPPFLQEFGQQRPADVSTFLQRYRRLTGWEPFQVYPGPSLAERIGGPLTEPIYRGPSLVEQALGAITGVAGTAGAPVTQAVPTAAAVAGPTGLEQALAIAADYEDPMNTIEAAAGNVYTYLQFGSQPPFIMFEVQDYFGWTDEELKDAGYVRGQHGWIRAETGPAVATGGGGGGVQQVVTYIPTSGGGGSARTNRSGLVNWRI